MANHTPIVGKVSRRAPGNMSPLVASRKVPAMGGPNHGVDFRKLELTLEEDKKLLAYFDSYVSTRTKSSRPVQAVGSVVQSQVSSMTRLETPERAQSLDRNAHPVEAESAASMAGAPSAPNHQPGGNEETSESPEERIVNFLSGSMGFDRDVAAVAAERCKGNVDQAVNDLLTNMEELKSLAAEQSGQDGTQWLLNLREGSRVDVQRNGQWTEGVIVSKNVDRNLIHVSAEGSPSKWFRMDTPRIAPRGTGRNGLANDNGVSNGEGGDRWVEMMDAESGLPYYYNLTDGQSTWEKPSVIVDREMPT